VTSDDDPFVVLVNNEMQFAIWPTGCETPKGWKIVAGPSPREDCLVFVRRSWTDMRPRSLRKAMGRSVK
jgi:MbtH protein